MSAGIALVVFIGSFLILSMGCRMPVAHGLGAASLLVFIACNLDTITVGQAAFNSLDSFTFLAIPFFIYAGTLMEHSGISKSLIDWIQGIIGRVRGSLGIICTLASMAEACGMVPFADGFGCTDCRCRTHLFRADPDSIARLIREAGLISFSLISFPSGKPL